MAGIGERLPDTVSISAVVIRFGSMPRTHLVIASALAATLVGCTTGGTGETAVEVPPSLADIGQDGLDDALGTTDRICVDVDRVVAEDEPQMVGPEDNRAPVFDVRSGEFLAGNFDLVVGRWSPAFAEHGAKIYWVPFDDEVATTGPLQVTVEPLDGDHQTVVHTFTQTAYTVASGAAEALVFWPSGTKFPEPGRYRLTSTAPGHWGCFELTV
jgi:hypothetical protein